MNKLISLSLGAIGLIIVVRFFYSRIPIKNIEEPSYTVVSKKDGYEIREYESYLIAETTIENATDQNDAARKGFPRIATYIFGENISVNNLSEPIAMTVPVNSQQDSESIAMTVPVNSQQDSSNGTYTVSFVMPKKYTLDTIPKPLSDDITLKQIPKRIMAVRQFGRSSYHNRFKKEEKKLISALLRDSLSYTGSATYARYNIPRTIPFLIRNEIHIQIQ